MTSTIVVFDLNLDIEVGLRHAQTHIDPIVLICGGALSLIAISLGLVLTIGLVMAIEVALLSNIGLATGELAHT